MRNSPSVGRGTVLPATATVKNKKPVSKPATAAASEPTAEEMKETVLRLHELEDQKRWGMSLRANGECHFVPAPGSLILPGDGTMIRMPTGKWVLAVPERERVELDQMQALMRLMRYRLPAAVWIELAPLAASQEAYRACGGNVKDADTTPKKAESKDAFTVRLSGPTSDLVRWYCKITHHRPQHVVEGIVHGELEDAKEAYENTYGDAAFDIVLGRVLDAQLESGGAQPALLSGEYGTSVHVSKDALLWLQRAMLDAGCPVEDIASATIVRALGSLYKGVQDQATAKSVQDWAAWKELNKAARDEWERRIGASNDVADAALA